MILRDLLRVLGSSDRRNGRNLTHEEAHRAFEAILSGEASDIQVGAFLVAMRWKGVTVEELTGFANAARERATIPCLEMPGVVCIAPPHDGYETTPPLEVGAGLVAAGAGVRILILTDRAVPPRRGVTAADIVDQLGLGFTLDPGQAEKRVEQIGFSCLSVPGMLPPLLRLRAVRGDIGVRTPLATVEKLILPRTAAVVLGAQHGPVLGTAVETMASLGHPSGIALQGLEGGVVPRLHKRTRGIELSGKHQTPLTVEPADFGLNMDKNPELPMFMPPPDGEGPCDNPILVRSSSDMIDAVLKGETGPARNAILLTAAVILKAAGRSMTLAEGVDAACQSLDSGKALELMAKVREAAR